MLLLNVFIRKISIIFAVKKVDNALLHKCNRLKFINLNVSFKWQN